jgi:hypothetical protein
MLLPYNPTYVRWQESMRPNWNGSLLEFWSMAIQQAMAESPTAKRYLTSPNFWPRVRDFLQKWMGPAYFVQEMQHRAGPDWVPSHPMPTLTQLRGQEPTYVWTGREVQHAGRFAQTGPLLGYGTPYTRRLADAAARLFVGDWDQSSGGMVDGPGQQISKIDPRYKVEMAAPDRIIGIVVDDMLGQAAQAGEPQPTITAEACLSNALAEVKSDAAGYRILLELAGSEQAIVEVLRQSCTKLVADCGGLTRDECVAKVCPGLTAEQCKGVFTDRFGYKKPEPESETPWWLIGVGVGLAAAAAAGGYYLAQSTAVGDFAMNPVDNTWGLGHIPVPAKLRHLSNFSDAFKPSRILDHKVWPQRGQTPETHLITVRADSKLSIMERDLESLQRLGLARIQSNDDCTVGFYFEN